MSQKENNKKILFTLTNLLPDLFGKSANNSINNALKHAINDQKVEIKNLGKNFLLNVNIKSKEITKYGFPDNHLVVKVDKYDDYLWNFSVVSEIVNKFRFSLEWNSDINTISRKRKRVKALPTFIYYKFFTNDLGKTKNYFKFNFNSKEIEGLEEHSRFWKFKENNLSFRFNINKDNNRIVLKSHNDQSFISKDFSDINLTFPEIIYFHPL